MNIEYWLLETQEDIDNFEMSLEIASPAEMAQAIKKIRELHAKDEHGCLECDDMNYPCPTIKALGS